MSECGDLSEESLTYQLWRAVTSCLAQKNKKKRDTMALKIQQKFIFEDSDHHVDLAGSQLQLLDPNQEVCHVHLKDKFSKLYFSQYFPSKAQGYYASILCAY